MASNPSLKKPMEPVPEPSLSQKSKKKSSGPCAACNQPLSGKTVRLPESTTRYHWACLKCAQCQEPFKDTSFYTDSARQIYHPKCYTAAMTETQACVRCSADIKEAYLIIHQARMHPKASAAAYCQPCAKKTDKIPDNAETRIVPQLHPPPPPQVNNNPLSPTLTQSMESLSTLASSHSNGSSTPTSPSSSQQQQQPIQQQQQVMPSSLMSRRAKPLPKFGMRKVCAGCNQTIASVHDEKPGPRATRWHKKCLCCQGCAKVLDSAAVVHDNPSSGGLDPWCRLCLLANNNKNQAIPNRRSNSSTIAGAMH
ncbi:hypothetical protein LRAMOSA04471 [Lichtheimia ramosa]|uniref:LIM zinc-binding domain-containing protein n=1 Tax=Lichtheimia ramosa TaxID=688394 RepID=A0A077WXB2_9FUNG|nr:hypothetical protein LRAMOSA04471 [Lichtheimia ramosa]